MLSWINVWPNHQNGRNNWKRLLGEGQHHYFPCSLPAPVATQTSPATADHVYISVLLLLLLSHFSRVQLFATPWTVTPQAPLSMGVSKQECWSGLPFPLPGDLPDPGIKPASALQAESLPMSHVGSLSLVHPMQFYPVPYTPSPQLSL